MKILIIKNRYAKKLDFKKGIEYLEENTPLKITLDEIETDFDFDFTKYSNDTYTGYGVDETVKEKLRLIVPRNTYHAVVFVYGNKAPGVRVSVTNYNPLFPETEFIQLAKVNDYGKTLNHELFHTFFHNLKRKGIFLDDPMDKVFYDGKWREYYNNGSYTSKPSNRTIAIELLKPWWKQIEKYGILDVLINTIMPPEVKKYKYFKDSEVIGLSPVLVEKLDKAREIAGIPFVITSGFRTKEHNDEVGGATNSLHMKGLAVDLRCRNQDERYKIVSGAIQAGLGEIAVYVKSGHVHVAVDDHQTLTVYNK